MALASGFCLGSLVIVGPLGAGGMGEVYRARDTRLDRQVAVKILPDVWAQDPERLARFEREAKTLAALNHPNIAQLHGFVTTPGPGVNDTTLHALVMELVEGEDLAQRLSRGPLPLDETLAIVGQIAEALEAAHALGIIHRDLKPANVRIRPDGTVKLLDFGLAKPVEPAGGTAVPRDDSPTVSSPAVTAGGVILGTAAYMAPEQAKGKLVDKRADVWAFGVVLYEMLCRRRPFVGEDTTEVISQVLQCDPDWTALPHNTPAGVRRVLRRCLEKNPKRRMRDCGDILIELADTSEAGRPLETPARTTRWPLALFAGAALGALAVGSVVFVRSPSTTPEAASPRRFAIVGAAARLNGGGRMHAAISRDGRRIVLALNQQLMVQSVGELNARPIAGTEAVPTPAGARGTTGLAIQPVLSPDGESVIYAQAGQLRRIPISGGTATVICTCPISSGATWNADGSILMGRGVSDGDVPGVWRVSDRGGTPERVVPAEPGQNIVMPTMLPDGDHVLFTVSDGQHWDEADLVVQSLKTGERRVLVKGGVHGRYLSSGHLVYGKDGAVHAVKFDLGRLQVVGDAVPVISDVAQATQSGAWGGYEFAVSDEGSVVYVPAASAAYQRVLVWVDRNGREEPLAMEPRAYQYPRLSPDGQRVVLDLRDRLNDIWYWDLARSTLTKVTNRRRTGGPAVWSGDGNAVIYGQYVNGAINLHSLSASGGSPRRLLTSPNGQVANDVTPDGSSLVVAERDRNEGVNLRLLRLDGPGEAEDLIRTPYNEQNADVSPDGRWIAYQSDESGRNEVYVRPFPKVAGGRWHVSLSGGTRPLWGRDGRELFFLDPDRRMTAVKVRTGPPLDFGRPQTLFDTTPLGLEGQQRNFDLAPEGTRFLMVRNLPPPTDVPSLVLIQNWLGELREAVR